jgi:hypothetical protein
MRQQPIVGAVHRAVLGALTALAMSAGAVTVARSESPGLPRLETNQAYVEDVTRASALAIDDPMAVFAYVLGSLPERVRVYPTENHYYFSFMHNRVRYAGNIKIDARLREAGKAMFVYYQEEAPWREDARSRHVLLDAAHGVTVERVGPLEYRVSYRATSVVFALNDLSGVVPPANALAPDEHFIGPVFDESAVRFFLVFNSRLKLFLYVLDETAGAADTLTPAAHNDRILIGRRTGFAFYRDRRRDRRILIGVFADNVRANNFFDGPFDQMPDNFIHGEDFRDAILALEPDLKGKIDRFGARADGERYAVTPYMSYRALRDLDVFDRCARSKRVKPSLYYACFVLPPGDESGAQARPLAMERMAR